MPEPIDLVDLILKRAGELRRAGVLDIAIGDFHVTLAPHQEEAEAVTATKPEVPTDPLLDPNTYGLPSGSRLPGLSHLEVMDEPGNKR